MWYHYIYSTNIAILTVIYWYINIHMYKFTSLSKKLLAIAITKGLHCFMITVATGPYSQ